MATEVTSEEVIAYAPEMSTEGDERITLFIGFAGDFVSETKWGKKYKQGIILMCCHLLKMAALDRAGAAGSVTAERVGEMSRSYSAPPADNEMAQSSYGQTFLMLRKTLVITPMVV